MPYRNILVGTDGSLSADRAVDCAARLAQAVGSDLIVASIYRHDPRSEWTDDSDLTDGDSWQGTSARGAEDMVVRAREIAARDRVATRGRTEPARRPGPGMVALSDELDVDLVVVGSRGLTGAKRFLLGSVPDHVAHHAPCDVLIVRTAD
jgi:nucleotide-binding universal stress UspA family protein